MYNYIRLETKLEKREFLSFQVMIPMFYEHLVHKYFVVQATTKYIYKYTNGNFSVAI